MGILLMYKHGEISQPERHPAGQQASADVRREKRSEKDDANAYMTHSGCVCVCVCVWCVCVCVCVCSVCVVCGVVYVELCACVGPLEMELITLKSISIMSLVYY